MIPAVPPPTVVVKRAVVKVQDFLKLESAAGLILMVVAIIAFIANNSALSDAYTSLLSTKFTIQFGEYGLSKALILWINDGLMAIFFFLVGLEIKREVMVGQLTTLDKAILPVIAAIGGMIGPALVYTAFNAGDALAMRGWAVPTATDIAFALGILALLGPRVPLALKVFLLAVAIIDDLGAIIIIALFYTENLSPAALGIGVIGVAALAGLNYAKVTRTAPYVLIGIIVWVCVLRSGIHATLAGVITALFIPLTGKKEEDQSPLEEIEHALHPWVAFLVLPIFAFANAGVSLSGVEISSLAGTIPLGVALGLLIGKQVGVMLASFLAVSTGVARLPEGTNWAQLYGVAALTGIGFTMSLFIGTLGFGPGETLDKVKLGVLLGSIASGIIGFIALRMVLPREANAPQTAPAE
ncbi:MAG: Na+/H+ antiporter NhaA [Neomegalonema sp.]|nr:Na+/H+ antiporter NhaA [Neomegalonema sp.]